MSLRLLLVYACVVCTCHVYVCAVGQNVGHLLQGVVISMLTVVLRTGLWAIVNCKMIV